MCLHQRLFGAQTCQADGMGFDPCVCTFENDAGAPRLPTLWTVAR